MFSACADSRHAVQLPRLHFHPLLLRIRSLLRSGTLRLRRPRCAFLASRLTPRPATQPPICPTLPTNSAAGPLSQGSFGDRSQPFGPSKSSGPSFPSSSAHSRCPLCRWCVSTYPPAFQPTLSAESKVFQRICFKGAFHSASVSSSIR